MANRTYFKLEINGIMMPEIYFNHDQAKAALKNICESNIATGGRIIMF